MADYRQPQERLVQRLCRSTTMASVLVVQQNAPLLLFTSLRWEPKQRATVVSQYSQLVIFSRRVGTAAEGNCQMVHFWLQQCLDSRRIELVAARFGAKVCGEAAESASNCGGDVPWCGGEALCVCVCVWCV